MDRGICRDANPLGVTATDIFRAAILSTRYSFVHSVAAGTLKPGFCVSQNVFERQ